MQDIPNENFVKFIPDALVFLTKNFRRTLAECYSLHGGIPRSHFSLAKCYLPTVTKTNSLFAWGESFLSHTVCNDNPQKYLILK